MKEPFWVKREREFAAEQMEKSRRAGDHHWRVAHMLTGQGDFVPGSDDGEEPKGY